MPPIEEADFIHTCLVWERTGINKNNEPVLAAPEEYPCRWVKSNRTTTTPEGTPIELTARVAMPVEVPNRSIVWKGRKRDWDGNNGRQELHEVVLVDVADDLLGKNTRREYSLSRFRNKLPTGTPEPAF